MPNKYLYLWVVQADYGHGYEDIGDPEPYAAARASLKETRASAGHPYPSRMIQRRVLNPDAVSAAVSAILTEPEPVYRVFVRNWYKPAPDGGREPGPGRKTILARRVSWSVARDMCEVYNNTHNPGKLSRRPNLRRNNHT